MAVAAKTDEPKLGELRRGRDLGRADGTQLYVWHACETCGKARWIQCKNGLPNSRNCPACHCRKLTRHGAAHPSWKGGIHKSAYGYLKVKLSPGDEFFSMASKARWVPQHRLVMAQHIGRPLLKTEHVHHKNGFRADNRIENLELVSLANHILYKSMCSKCALRIEIRLLRRQIAGLTLSLQSKLDDSNGGIS